MNAYLSAPGEGAPLSADFDIELKLLLEGVYLKYQHDFRHYAIASLRRRIMQAMERFGCKTVSRLQERVLHEPEIFAQMLQYFTVQLSEMFRDPDYFRALREEVVPVLRTYPSIKFWIAGCSSGEEVWSFLIMLAEEGLLDRSILYATDINPQALSIAEAGVYPVHRIAQFSDSYLRAGGKASLADYYLAAYDDVIFDRQLKKNVVFADHSLATDSVFSEVHVVSCRNVLIYFNRKLQDRAIGLFRDALVHRGFLCLGSKESLSFSAHAAAFSDFRGTQRIFRKAVTE